MKGESSPRFASCPTYTTQYPPTNACRARDGGRAGGGRHCPHPRRRCAAAKAKRDCGPRSTPRRSCLFAVNSQGTITFEDGQALRIPGFESGANVGNPSSKFLLRCRKSWKMFSARCGAKSSMRCWMWPAIFSIAGICPTATKMEIARDHRCRHEHHRPPSARAPDPGDQRSRTSAHWAGQFMTVCASNW